MKVEQKKLINVKIFEFIILINIIPVIICNIFTKKSIAVPTSIITIVYIIQTGIILFYFFKERLKIDNKTKVMFFILLLFTMVMAIVQLYNLTNDALNKNDIMNLLTKFFMILTLIVLLSTCYLNKESLRKIYLLFFVVGMLACVYNLLFYNIEIKNIIFANTSYALNIKGFFSNRNQFAQFLCIAFISTVWLYNNQKNKYYILCGIIILINLLCTMSRTAIISILAFEILYCFLNRDIKGRIKYLLFLIISFTIIYWITIKFFPSLVESINKIFIRAETLETASGRKTIWEVSTSSVFESNPIFGIGRFRGIDILKLKGFHFTQFHNIFIEAFVSGGLFELILLIFMIWKVIKKMIYSKFNETMNKSERNIYISGMFLFIILGMFESCNRFSIGYVDTLFTIFFFSLPILRFNYGEK